MASPFDLNGDVATVVPAWESNEAALTLRLAESLRKLGTGYGPPLVSRRINLKRLGVKVKAQSKNECA